VAGGGLILKRCVSDSWEGLLTLPWQPHFDRQVKPNFAYFDRILRFPVFSSNFGKLVPFNIVMSLLDDFPSIHAIFRLSGKDDLMELMASRPTKCHFVEQAEGYLLNAK